MKQLLVEATNAKSLGRLGAEEFSLVNINAHVEYDSPLLGTEGGLIIQDDINDLKVSAEDASRFFVIGLVRRPCDYMVSSWAFTSLRQLLQPSGLHEMTMEQRMAKFGTSPPYDNSQDRTRFATWFRDIARNRDEGKARHEGSIFMSSAIADRYDAPDYVHCWVRTHEMVDDLKGCLEQYEACG